MKDQRRLQANRSFNRPPPSVGMEKLKVDERQLKQLIGKSERGTLTEKKLDQYRILAERAEQVNLKRAEALAELARRRGKPARTVMQEIDSEMSKLYCARPEMKLSGCVIWWSPLALQPLITHLARMDYLCRLCHLWLICKLSFLPARSI